jgi:hypothetical protein
MKAKRDTGDSPPFFETRINNDNAPPNYMDYYTGKIPRKGPENLIKYIQLDLLTLPIVKNDTKQKYCSISNYLVNTGNSIKFESDDSQRNWIEIGGKKYNLYQLEWKKSFIIGYKLDLHIIHKDLLGNTVIMVIPLRLNTDDDLVNPTGVNSIIKHYEYIPDLTYKSGIGGKVLFADLSELLFIFNDSGFRYYRLNDTTELYIGSQKPFNSFIANSIFNKIKR